MRSSCLFLLPLLVLTSAADTIRMRNGTEFEGVVIKENPDSYIMMIQVTKSIRDQREIPKVEILEIVGEKKDVVAFETIETFVPTADFLESSAYTARIRATQEFLKTHSSSRLAKPAKEILKTLEAENAIIADGGIKFNGDLIAGSDRAARAYPLNAAIAAAKVTQLGTSGKFTPALRAWDELQRDFPSSQAYITTIPFAVKLMRSQLNVINNDLATFDQRMKKRAEGLERLSGNNLSRTERALAEQAALYTKRVEAEKKARIKWLTLNPDDKGVMTTMKSSLEQAITRLRSLKTETIPDGDAAWKEAWDVLNGSPTPAEATAAINTARNGRIPPTYLKILEDKVPSK